MKKGNIYEGVVKKVDFPNKAYVEVSKLMKTEMKIKHSHL